MGFGVKMAYKYFDRYHPKEKEVIEYTHYTMIIIPKGEKK